MMNIDSLLVLPFEVYRLRLLLRPKRACRIPPHQAAMFYALLCDANAVVSNQLPAMPDGVLLDAPDQAVVLATPEHPISLGLNLLIPNDSMAGAKLNGLIDGLRSLGRKPANHQWLREFTVDRIEDMNLQRAIQSAGQATSVSADSLKRQFDCIKNQKTLSLRWSMPLRCSRPKPKRLNGHHYLDETYCPAQTILNRLQKRLTQLGWNITTPSPTRVESIYGGQGNPTEMATTFTRPTISEEALASSLDVHSRAQTIANELVWLDIGYGIQQRKTLGGVVGQLVIDVQSLREWQLAMLILGQYIRVGENTRFGFGAYTIDECGDLAPHCPRTESLLERCLSDSAIDRVSSEMQLESGTLTQVVSDIRNERYSPEPCVHVNIPKSDGSSRQLAIPSLQDRAVARMVLDSISDPVDAFLESSSMAYRRGLGRNQAARRLQSHFRQGYRWAIKADFFKFFDHIDHAILERRLRAYLPDPHLVQLLMQCVRSGSPASDRGVPTGSPLSPLLANLFLDHFDEEIVNQGAKLIRYTDDFLVLFQDSQHAEAVFQKVLSEAEELRLELNRQKTATLELSSGFDYLGFRFERREEWQLTAPHGPQAIEDIGWKNSKSPSSKPWPTTTLPGEGDFNPILRNRSLILGSTISRVRVQSDQLIIENDAGSAVQRVTIDSIHSLSLIGDTVLDWRAIQSLVSRGVSITSFDHNMRMRLQISSEPPLPDAKGVMAQAELQYDTKRQIEIARELIASKVNNYAVLGARYWKHSSGRVHEMYEISQTCRQSTMMNELLGLEGRAAAIWYGSIGELLGQGFVFQHRVAPEASDPVNVMLNWAQTLLYRWMTHCIHETGLIPTLGSVHQPRAGHLTLASDLQEPMRHLMDRTVIEAARILSPNDFVDDESGPFPLSMRPRARTKFLELVHRTMALSVTGFGQSEPASYQQQCRWLARQYRHSILNLQEPCRSFWHPSPVCQSK